MARKVKNHGCSPGRPCRLGEIIPIDQGAHLGPFHFIITLLANNFTLFNGNRLGIGDAGDEIDLLRIVTGLKQVQKDRLVHSPFAEFEVVAVDGRFSAVCSGTSLPVHSGVMT